MLFSTTGFTHEACRPKILDVSKYFLNVILSFNSWSMVKDTLEINNKKKLEFSKKKNNFLGIVPP